LNGGLAPPCLRDGVDWNLYLFITIKATNTKILQRNKSLLRRLCNLAQIILIQYDVLEAPKVRGIVDKFYKDSLLILETRGLNDLVSVVKTARNQIMNVALGTPLSGPGLDSEGFPKRFGYLKDLVTSVNGLRAVLTLLTLTRAFTQRAEPDLSTIENSWKGIDTITDKELNLALKLLQVRKGSVGLWDFPHISTKKGPQGQALLASLSELTLLSSEQVEYIKLLGGESLSKMIDENLEGLDILEMIKSPGIYGYFSVARW